MSSDTNITSERSDEPSKVDGKEEETDLNNSIKTEDTSSENNKEEQNSETEESEAQEVEQSFFDRFLNIILCRGDLAKEKLEAQPVAFTELFRYASFKEKAYIIMGCLLAICIGILQPMTCVISGLMANLFLKTEKVTGNDDFYYEALHQSFAFLAVGLVLFVLCFLQSYFFYNGCASIVNGIRERFIEAVLRQDSAWFDHRDAGMITALLTKDLIGAISGFLVFHACNNFSNIDRIQDGVGDKIGLILRGVFNFLSSTVLCFYFNWRTTLVLIGTGPVGAIIMGIMARVAAKPTKQLLDTACEAGAVAEEAIMNVKTVAACNGQETMVEKLSKILKKGERSAKRMYFWNGFFEGLMFFQLYVFYAFGFLESIIHFYQGVLTDPGTVFIVTNTMMFGAYFLGLLGPHMMTILKARVAAAVIYKTIERKPANMTKNSDRSITAGNVRGEIEFIAVHFTYPTRKQPILNGLSWKAELGETVALVGHSGCGKSTTIGLLTRLYTSLKGRVLLDGMDVTMYKPAELRRIIGIVQQEPYLFNGTIRENICLGRPGITEEKMIESAKVANAHIFIGKLEKGYDTVLGTGGVSLSGGQKQRIAIARAIASDPKILLLDEATSALDTESEKIVQVALQNASRGRTTIVIAHRLSTLRNAHKIYVLDKGVVCEVGTHYGLIEKGGLYATLAKAQEIEQVNPEKFDPHERDPALYRMLSISEERPVSRFGFRSSGIERLSMASNVTSSDAVVEYEIDEETGKKSKRSAGGMLRYYQMSLLDWKQTMAGFVCALLRGLELPLIGLFTLVAYETLQAGKDDYSTQLVWTIVFAMALGVWCWFFICTTSYFSGWAAELVTNRLKVSITRNLLNQDAAYFDRPGSSTAACVASLSINAPNAMALLDPRITLLVNNGTAIFCSILLCFIFCYQNGLVCVALVTTLLILQFTITYALQKVNDQKFAKDSTAEMAIEIFEQARTIQLLTVEKYFLDKYAKMQDTVRVLDHKASVLQSLTFALLISYLYFSDFSTYGVGISLLYHGVKETKDIFVSAMSANMSGWALVFATPSLVELLRAHNACRALFQMAERSWPGESGKRNQKDRGLKPEVTGKVSVEKVQFAYPARPNLKVARNLNLRANPGEAIALVGASGCGKSTVIALLERFYGAQSGKVKLDDTEIDQISLKHLRKNIALVGQEPVLFRGSIYENIVLGVDGVSMDDVVTACRTANAAKFIEAFPMGYDTDVGEKGRNLSGGQKQRIAIARALIRNPKVLLLDEATSALDTESEKMVQQALNEASCGRTSITIAHRLSTIQNADRIYFIENGAVVEYGTHQELLESDGKYAALVNAQSLGKSE